MDTIQTIHSYVEDLQSLIESLNQILSDLETQKDQGSVKRSTIFHRLSKLATMVREESFNVDQQIQFEMSVTDNQMDEE